MTLIKDAAVAEDLWFDVSENGAAIDERPVIISLDHWEASRDELSGRNAPLGIRLKSDQPPSAIADDLDRFELIALEFPNLNDGRAFSYARLLRERYGFKGEIRAVGEVLQDQLFFMQRCGFDSYELPEGRDAEGAIQSLQEFSVAYQSAADGLTPAARLRTPSDKD